MKDNEYIHWIEKNLIRIRKFEDKDNELSIRYYDESQPQVVSGSSLCSVIDSIRQNEMDKMKDNEYIHWIEKNLIDLRLDENDKFYIRYYDEEGLPRVAAGSSLCSAIDSITGNTNQSRGLN